MLPKYLLDSDDDWIEATRRKIYPKIHDELVSLGDLIGIRLFATGTVGWNQYVGKFDEDEESIEEELEALSSIRNPIACLKELRDGRLSEGSWVLLHEDYPELIEEGMQLHFTLFERDDGQPGREVYAHYEDDWRVSPIAHLRGENWDVKHGVKIAGEVFNDSTFLVLQ